MKVLSPILLALGLFAICANAEINGADTIQWMTADSDVVVIGSVRGATERQGKSSGIYSDMTIRVTETLKGAPRDTLQVTMARSTWEKPEPWMTDRSEVMFFMLNSSRMVTLDLKDYANTPFALWGGSRGVYVLGDSKMKAYTIEFGVITDRDSLIAAVRAAARSTATKSHTVDTPVGTPAFHSLWGGSAVWLQFPIDETLEREARKWITSASPRTREAGVIALKHFKSADNIVRIERLLDDTGYVELLEPGKKTRRYVIREAAHTVLTEWNVPHRRPVIDEPVP
jgi:hypothetical protein